MSDDPQRERRATTSGLGGIFKGLGDMLEILADLAERAPTEVHREGTIPASSDRPQAVYGFTVRTGISGPPRVERFGNVRSTPRGPEVAPVREPMVDLFDEGDELLVIAELPGVDDGEVEVTVEGTCLMLSTTGERRYAKELTLPAPADPATLQRTYRNGILELRVRKLVSG
ncbi:MAG: Hsp20/alpha crystallin family protein [Candidatus Viridilinea halotolerans]|uniref:Hsp20/alpha crystallin family protein n=1 Tax=Candidatus Viridilinea halotolerans TaxID=2491704 RepID=A0A426TQZ1_9CHLR|nr:MAG: Hsp20/alpha crystallin family protein [Candidatus Viridilinea halotolerans]